jgi:hypothetical protein
MLQCSIFMRRRGPTFAPLKPDISPDERWRISMKKTLLAVFTVLSLGTGSAFAQGLPAGSTPPVYGKYAFTNHVNDPQVHLLGQGTVFGRLFGHSNNRQVAANKTDAAPAKGS